MKCNFHENVAAEANCIACGKALCSECAVEIDGSTACRGECERAVKVMKTVISKEEASSPKYRTFITTLLLLAMGSYFCKLGYNPDSLLNFNFTLGALLFMLGIVNLITNLTQVRQSKRN